MTVVLPDGILGSTPHAFSRPAVRQLFFARHTRRASLATPPRLYPSPVNDVTRILAEIRDGRGAADQLLPLVYDELRRIAAHKMSSEAPGHTLQPTALVHEAWLRLVGNENPVFDGRAHFFTAAAEAMRRILVDAARRRQSLKRGSGSRPEELPEDLLAAPAPADEILAVDEALELLAVEDAVAANLVKLRYFVGLSMDDAAAALNLPLRSTERVWAYARAWLRRRIAPPPR